MEEKTKHHYVDCPRCKGTGKVKKIKKRSVNQNKYYWGVVIMMAAAEMGEDSDSCHEIFKYKFNTQRKILKDQTIADLPRSTTELTTEEFNRYIEIVRAWCRDYLNLEIPLPEQITEEMLLEYERIYHSMFH